IRVAVRAPPNGVLRLEEKCLRLDYFRLELPQGSDVVENPEGTAMGGHDQVVTVDGEIAHRGVRQIQLQRLPGISVAEGHKNRSFGTGKQQSVAKRILADHVNGS